MSAKDMEEYYSKLKKLKEDSGSYINNNGYRAKAVEGEDQLLKHVEMG